MDGQKDYWGMFLLQLLAVVTAVVDIYHVIEIYHHSVERRKNEMNLHLLFTMSGNVALVLQIMFLLLNIVESSAVPLSEGLFSSHKLLRNLRYI